MLKYVLLALFFILNILAVIIWLSTGTAYLTFQLIAIYFVIGLLNASLYVNLRKGLRWQLINIFAAFCVGIMIFGYTKYFPNETSPIPSNPFENFLIMCPAALVMGSFGMLVNFGIRKFIVQLRAKPGESGLHNHLHSKS